MEHLLTIKYKMSVYDFENKYPYERDILLFLIREDLEKQEQERQRGRG